MQQYTEQIGRIKQKLATARRIDEDLKVSGADSHQYQISPPLQPKEIERFEQKQGISLPDCYKAFLCQMGNGGKSYRKSAAGPYYGIYPLGAELKELREFTANSFASPCVLAPTMTDEEWSELALREDEDEDDVEVGHGDTLDLDVADTLYNGILPLGSQGCDNAHGLILNGPYRGRVVYLDITMCQKPHICYEENFLDWYERWLDEIESGILLQSRVAGFGILMGGDDEQLFDAFDFSEDRRSQIICLLSMQRLLTASRESSDRLLALSSDTDPELRHCALSALTKLDYHKAVEPLRTHLLGTDTDMFIAAQAVYYLAPDHIVDWQFQLLERFDQIQSGVTFDIFGTLLKEAGVDFTDKIVPYCEHPDDEIRAHAISYLARCGNKKRFVDIFVQALGDSSSRVLFHAINAIVYLRDPRLLRPVYELVLATDADDEYMMISLENHVQKIGFQDVQQFLSLYEIHGDAAVDKAGEKPPSWFRRLFG